MFEPLFAVGEQSATPTWVTLLLGLGGGGLITGALAYLTTLANNRAARRVKQDERESEERKSSASGNSAVEVQRMQTEATERQQLFQAWQENEKKYAAQAESIRAEMQQMRRTFGHEIRNLRQYNTALLDFYHAQYATLGVIVMQCRIMRARLKKIQKEEFDEAEFPEIDISFFDPKNLPKMPMEIFGEDDAEGKRKISGTVLLTPDLNNP